MTLVKLWKENPDQISKKRLHQIIVFAGDGKLGDSNPASIEFREYLSRVPPELLEQYANDCLEKGFQDSGLALQDIVNEVGKRLGYEVEGGRYRGIKNEIGFDGIWKSPNGHMIVVEVKTTDAYRLPLETVANYRKKLLAINKISEENSSILIVVGREDTGEIEAQIRGSRHAWDVRLISVDALLRLMKIRIELDSPSVESRIRAILIPREFTRVDEIIDLVFSTAEEMTQKETDDQPSDEFEKPEQDKHVKPKKKPVSFNLACVREISKHFGVDFTQQSRVLFTNSDSGTAIFCAASKEYQGASHQGYWFAFHPHQLSSLRDSSKSFACFGCGSERSIAVIPIEFIEPLLGGMNKTVKEDGEHYWHIQIEHSGTKWILRRRKDHDPVDISSMMLLRQ